MEELIKVPAKLGCDGCWYDTQLGCPVIQKEDKLEWDFSPCQDENGDHIIFIPKDENKGFIL